MRRATIQPLPSDAEVRYHCQDGGHLAPTKLPPSELDRISEYRQGQYQHLPALERPENIDQALEFLQQAISNT